MDIISIIQGVSALVIMAATICLAIATVCLAIFNLWYIKLSKSMLDEMKSTRDPSVFADIELPEKNYIQLSIGNTGVSSAKNIKFTVDENLPWFSDTDSIKNLPIVKNGIPYLSSGRILKISVGHVNWKKINKTKGIVKINLEYESEFNGEKYYRENIIDLTQYGGVRFDSFHSTGESVARAIRDAERTRSSEKRLEKGPRGLALMENFNKKDCPICGEKIPQKAKKCPQCHEFIDSSDKNKKN